MARRLKVKMSTRLMKKRVRRSGFNVSKRCKFTSGEVAPSAIDFKNVDLLRSFVTERGKILPARISGTSAFYQRQIAREIKKARMMALLPYSSQA